MVGRPVYLAHGGYMQKITGLLIFALCCGGCAWHKNTNQSVSVPAPETAAAPTANAVITAEPISTPNVPPVKTEKQPAQPAPAQTPKAATTPVQTPPVQPAPAPSQPAQPPATNLPPVPDKAVFKDEMLISLEGRKLGPLAALSPQSDKTFSAPWQGEQLKFGLYYSGIKVGTAYIKNRGIVDVNGQAAYVIQTSAFSASVIDTVFKVRDINLSWLDARNFHSLGYSQSLREGHYQRDEWVTFDYSANTYRGELNKKSGTRALSGAVTAPVLDILSALYFVRGQKLENGKDVVFDILNREEQYPLVVKIIKRETVKTPAGKFKCVVVEPQFRGEGIFVSKGKSLQVWLTDDERKLPVKMKTEVFIGSVSAQLLEYKHN